MAALAQVQLNPMRVAIYVRISPTPEDEVGGNYSIASQIHEIRQHAIQKGFGDVPDAMVFIDENFTGKNLDRPALERLRGLIRDRMIDVVIAFSSDRLTRRLAHLLLLQDECDMYDAKLEYVKESYEKSPEGRMAMSIKGVFNEYEREKILERTTRCRRQKMREGHPHTVGKRFGYDYIGRAQGNRGELVINTAEATTVLECFVRYDTGTGRNCLYQIRKWLNDSGVLSANAGKRTKGAPSRHELKMLPADPATGDQFTTNVGRIYEWSGKRWYRINDGKWSKQTVLQLLTNPMYIGRMRTPSGIEPIPCPAIVSEELFHRVQQKIAANKTALAGRQSREYLFAHMIWCTACGGRCYAQSGRYRCGNYSTKTFVRGCTASQIQHKRLDPAGWKIIWQTITDPPVLLSAMREYHASEMQARPDNRDELRKAVEHLKRLLARATEVLNDPDQPTPYDEAKRNVLRLRGDLVAAEEQLKRQVLTMPDEFQVQALVRELLDPEAEPKEFADRREVLQHLEIKIHYLDNEVEIHGKFPVPGASQNCDIPPNGGSGKRNSGVSDYSFSQGSIPFVLKRRVA